MNHDWWADVLAAAIAIVFIVVAYCIGLFAGQTRHLCIGCHDQRVEACGEICGHCKADAKAMNARIKPDVTDEWTRLFVREPGDPEGDQAKWDRYFAQRRRDGL